MSLLRRRLSLTWWSLRSLLLVFFFFFSPVQWRQSSQVALSGSRSEGGGCHGSKGASSLSVYDATHTHPQAHKGKCVLEVFLTAGL